MPATANHAFRADLRAAEAAIRDATIRGAGGRVDRHWQLWLEFCSEHTVDPWFTDGADPIPYLLVYAQRYRDGRLTSSGRPVRAGTVSDSIQSIGQAYQWVGAEPPHKDRTGRYDLRLKHLLAYYAKQDPPPTRVKPVPVQLVQALLRNAHLTTDEYFRATADMTCIGFYFLMRPGEHTFTRQNTPFHLRDVRLWIGGYRLRPDAATTDAQFQAVSNVQLEFTTQKNGVRGEVISQGRSGDPLNCPVKAVVRRVRHLLSHGAPQDTPLCAYYTTTTPDYIRSRDITRALRTALTQFDPHTIDIRAGDIDARSLRSGGATALLCAGIDRDTTQLLGRWRSDAMLRYLHVQANPAMNHIARAMFQAPVSFLPFGTTPPVT